MKNLLFLITLSLTMSCCNNDNDKPVAEIDKLPPATQTGANTVGCLLDGKAFLPGNQTNSTNCFYQLVGGEYYFVMAFGKTDSNSITVDLGVGTQKLQIQQDGIYNLFELFDNNAYGGYSFGTFNTYTTHTHTGELTITKLNEINHIVSGTFWYDIVDFQGNLHQIREGRFDMQYTN